MPLTVYRCGPLRHGIELASGERHVSVIGLDNSPCMLQYAQEQVAEELSAEQAAQVSVMNADMRRFQVGSRDAVVPC